MKQAIKVATQLDVLAPAESGHALSLTALQHLSAEALADLAESAAV